MGSTQRNVMLSNSASQKLGSSFYANVANIKVHEENPRSKFFSGDGNSHKSSKAKRATKKKRRK